jgi:hypothetical protein
MQLLLFFVVAMGASFTSAKHIHKREEGLTCDSPDSCVNWYTTGSAQCSSGYKATPYEVRGSPPGTYCERSCNDDERKECAAQKCTFYKKECSTYPGSTICAKALIFCDAPIKTTKDNCVQLRMGQPVKYNDAAGTCEVDPDAEKDDHYLRFRFEKTSVDLSLVVSCAPVTAKGVKSVTAAVLSATSNCGYADTSAYEITYRCKEGKEKFDKLEDVVRKACAVADHPGSAAPVFVANKG